MQLIEVKTVQLFLHLTDVTQIYSSGSFIVVFHGKKENDRSKEKNWNSGLFT